MENRLLLLSDLHLCHIDWHGREPKERLVRMAEQVCAYHEKTPIDEILMLGDYSLDFWQWSIGGSYLHTPPVSNTDRFVQEIIPLLPMRPRMIAGNHEQYGRALWKQITGEERQFSLSVGSWSILMLDTFSADLDPKVNSDGTYTGADVAFVREALAQSQGRVILCAHHFDPRLDSAEFTELVATEPRIVCLFAGHTHASIIEDYAGKPLIRTGNYSYTKGDIRTTMWGYRELILTDHSLETAYITPENRLLIDGQVYDHRAGKQDMVRIEIG